MIPTKLPKDNFLWLIQLSCIILSLLSPPLFLKSLYGAEVVVPRTLSPPYCMQVLHIFSSSINISMVYYLVPASNTWKQSNYININLPKSGQGWWSFVHTQSFLKPVGAQDGDRAWISPEKWSQALYTPHISEELWELPWHDDSGMRLQYTLHLA